MAKEGIPTEADILAAIDLGARAAGEEARKGFGLKPNVPVVTDPVVQAADVAVSEKPAIAPVSGDGHPADVERAKKGGVGRKRVIKKKKGAPARGGKKTPAVKPAKSSGAVVSDPVVLEEDAKPPVNLPERGVVRDSVYESRMTVPHPIDDIERQLAGIQLQADEGTQMADIASVASVTLDSVIRADRAAEAAETRLIQIQEEEGSVTPDQYEAVSEIGAVPTSETAPEAASPEIDPLDHLKSEVAALRSKYASRQYEHGRMMERLKRSPIGRFLGESDIDKDNLEYWKTEYEEKMTALREAELGKIKESGLKGQELKEAMAGLLRASKVDEAIALLGERDKYRLEGKEWPARVYDAFRAIGEYYNSMPPKKKIAIGLGVALGAGLTGGVAVGAGAAFIRKLIAGAGLSVAIDAKLDSGMMERFRARMEEEIGSELGKIFGTGVNEEGSVSVERTEEENMSLFEERLRAASHEADPAFQSLVRRRGMNGVIGGVAGLGLSFGGSELVKEGVGYLHETGVTGGARDLLFGTAPEQASVAGAAPQELLDAQRESDMRSALQYAQASPLEQAEIRNVTGMTDGQLRALAIEHDLSRPEAPIREDSMKEIADRNEADLSRAVAEGKADGAWDAMGKDGSIDQSKLTLEEQRALEAETGASAKESVDMHSRMDFVPAIENEPVLVKNYQDLIQQDVPQESSVYMNDFDAVNRSEFSPEFRSRMDGWFDQIFRVDGEMPGSGHDWVIDRERLGNISIRDMMHDAVMYQRGEVSGYRTGLSVEQLKNFAQFFQGAGTGVEDQKEMAKIIYATMREEMTVAEYLEKVAPLAKQGQRFGLFTTPV